MYVNDPAQDDSDVIRRRRENDKVNSYLRGLQCL